MKSLNLSNETNELKKIEIIFPKTRDLIIDKLKNIIQLQNNSKLDDIEYNTKRGKCYNTGKYSLFIVFLKCT